MTRKPKGITLVELILVVVVMAVVMAALAPFIGTIQRAWQWGDRRTEMMQHGRVSLDRMVKTLRNCTTIVAIDGETGQGTFIEFTNADGDQIAYFHNVTDNAAYYDATLGDNNLGMRTILASDGSTTTSLLAEAVQDITFSYYKYGMDTSVTPNVADRILAISVGEVEAVDIEMQMSDPEGEITSTLPLTSFVFCRVISGSVSGGEVWVADTRNNQVVKLDSGGTELVRASGFNNPYTVSVNPTDGSCWVADTMNHQIVKLDSNGGEIGRFSGFNQPVSVSVNPTDGSCWVADVNNFEIVKLDSDGAEVVRITLDGGDIWPYSVSVNPTDGSCWVAEAMKGRVIKLDSGGRELSRTSSVRHPRSVSVNSVDGSCWVADYAFFPASEVIKLNSNAGEVGRFSGFNFVFSVSVNPTDSSCWVADTNNNQVVKLDSNGGEIGRFSGFNQPVSVSVNPTDGSCWVADTRNDQIVKLDSNGGELGRFSGFLYPQSVSVDTGERD